LLTGPEDTCACGYDVPLGLNSLLLLGRPYRGVTGQLVALSHC